MSHLILVRHGQSEWNLENKFTGWVDVELASKGKLEACKAGELIKEKNNRFGVVKFIPANDGRFLVVTDDGHLQSYNTQLSQLWTKDLGLNFDIRAKVDQNRIFVGPGKDTLWILDSETGNIQDGVHFLNGFECQAQDNDLFLVYNDGRLMKLTLDGEISWTSDFELGLPSESFFHTDVNLIVPFAKGVAINVDSNTGTEIWRSDTLKRLAGFWQFGSGFLMQDVKYQIQFYK